MLIVNPIRATDESVAKIAFGDATDDSVIPIDNGTNTKILFDPDFSAASDGSLIEIATITGLADGGTIDDATQDLVVVPT